MLSKRGSMARGVRRAEFVAATKPISVSGATHFGTSLPTLATIGGKEPASAPAGASSASNRISRAAMEPPARLQIRRVA